MVGARVQGPHSRILMKEGEGVGQSDVFGSEILAQSDFLGVYERRRDFFGSRKKNRGIFLGCDKRTKGFFWVS